MDEWIYSSGKACYNSLDEGYALNQPWILIPGKLYVITVTVSGMTKGVLIIDSLEDKPEITEDGIYNIVGIALVEDLVFIGGNVGPYVFDGCIDDAGARHIPFYTIKDVNDFVIFEQVDGTGVSAYNNNIQYQIDWSEISEGCYKITFTDEVIEYESDLLSIKDSHECSIQLTWRNDENAYGFDYTDLDFTQTLRVNGKKWHPKYQKDKEVFKDSQGNRFIIRSDTSKVEILTLNDLPEYAHNSIAIAIEHDDFMINNVTYVVEEAEYTPKWRRSSNLAPVDVEVIKKAQNLTNENCA